jgi:hypothetical protein
MKKHLAIFTLVAVICAIACNQPTKVDETNKSKASFTTRGPEIDLMKKEMEAYAKGDWDTYRACFDDSALLVVNQWPSDSTTKKVSLDSAIANHKKGRETMWDSMNINKPIYEVVTDSAGNKYGHIWAKLTPKFKKTHEEVTIVVFGSVGFKNNKLAWVWNIYDRTKIVSLMK